MERRQQAGHDLLDLSKRKKELDIIFDSVINKIPDLCMPASFRLAGENDYFNQTKDLKLVPFRKQTVFERTIRPFAQSTTSFHADSNADSKSIKITTPTRSHLTGDRGNGENAIKGQSMITSERDVKVNEVCNSKFNRHKAEVKRKFKLRKKLLKEYSQLKVKRTIMDEKYQLSSDKIFMQKLPPEYPYANPIPDCMLTEKIMDNLREIIVSSVDIEWKMLTSARPRNEYEEKYFDKLISLHRERHKARIDSGYYNTSYSVPFKHSRHSYLIRYNLIKEKSEKKDRKIQSTERNCPEMKLKTPTLILTSEDRMSKTIVKYIDADEESDGGDISNNSNISSCLLKTKFDEDIEKNSKDAEQIDVDNSSGSTSMKESKENTELLENRVEEIMNKLMKAQLEDAITF